MAFLYREKAALELPNVSKCLLCVLVFGYFIARLYNRELGWLVSFGCADAANHLALFHAFEGQDPRAYHGFSALYVAWWFVQKIFNLSSPQALGVALTLPLFAISYFLAFFSPPLTADRKGLLQSLFYLFALVVLSETVILPLVHYNQADGYLAHLFSVSIFLFTLLLARNLTFTGLLAVLVGCRFSYGLQLPDIFAATSLLFAVYALRDHRPGFKILKLSCSLIFLLATALGLATLTKIFSMSGSIVSQSLDNAFGAQVAGIALLLACGFRNSLELWFLVATSCIQAFWLFSTHESDYYFIKLFLYSSLLLGVVLLRELIFVIHQRQVVTAMSWIAVATLLVLAQRPYAASYLERSMPGAGYTYLAPLVDPKVEEIINEVLSNDHKEFGFYYTSRWPQFSFFNALRGRPFDYSAFTNPQRTLEANSCVFWTSNANDLGRLTEHHYPEAVNWYQAMNQRKDAKVVKYQVEWAGRQTIKYLCAADIPIVLP